MPSAQVTITQLPAAGPITGTEAVPIVQNGKTVQTTTAAIAASPSQNQTFITLNQESTLPNSRALSAGSGLTLTDGGALSTLQVNLTGSVASLVSSTSGLQAKIGDGSLVGRTITGSTNVSITNGNGVSGNPTISLSGTVGSLAGLAGTGILGIVGGSSVTSLQITGTTNEIDVANGTGPGNPTIGLSDNPIIPGTGAVTVPIGTTGERPGASGGQIRYNTTTSRIEGYQSGSWSNLGVGDGSVTSVNASGGVTGLSFTGGPITTSGVLTLTGTPVSATNVAGGAANQVVYQTGASTTSFVVAPTVTDTFLKWDGSTFIWSALPGAGTVTSVNASGGTTGLTFSGGPITAAGTLTLAGTLIVPNGGTGVTSYVAGDILYYSAGDALSKLAIGTNGQVMTSSGTAPQWSDQSTLAVGTATNLAGGAAGSIPYQTASGTTAMLATSSGVLVGGTTPSYSTAPSLTGTNFSSIPNAALQNSSITVGTTAISLGASSLTLGGLTSVAVTQDPSSALELTTKQYVDTLVSSGITYHTPVKYEVPNSTGNLNAIYNQPGGPGVGVGATLTNAGTLAAFAPDGPTAQVGDRILVYNQTNQFENGVYEVMVVGDGSTPWVLQRTTDADSYGLKDPNALGSGDAFFVTSGNTGAGETYVCNTTGTITFGTTAITFAQVSYTQVYSAGTGLTLSGTQFSITNTGVVAASYGTASQVPTIAINAQGQITSATNTSIAIDASAVTSGTINTSRISGSYTGITGVGTLTAGTWNANTIGTGYGGTGVTGTPSNGQILIGNGTGYTLATLTAGTGVSITNGAGSVTINSSGATIDDVIALAIALG